MSEWISVKDRLPKNETRVIVFVIGGIIDMDTYDGTCGYEPWNCYLKEAVTHWMPLPEPPKE